MKLVTHFIVLEKLWTPFISHCLFQAKGQGLSYLTRYILVTNLQ